MNMKIDTQLVVKLRSQTGAGILDCKQALQKAGGELTKAVDILRRKGLARAAKRGGREAREGIIRLRVADDGKKAAVLELNCETDFVARTPELQKLAEELLEEVYRRGSDIISETGVVRRVQETAGKIGEKIAVSRALVWEKEGFIGGYLHHNSRLAVLIELSRPAKTAAREIAMQVAVSNPEYLSDEEISSEVVEKEKDIFRDQFSEKPEAVREKIVEGKWRKRLTEICLLDHPYIRDPDISVREFLKKQDADLKVKEFIRWHLGEE